MASRACPNSHKPDGWKWHSSGALKSKLKVSPEPCFLQRLSEAPACLSQHLVAPGAPPGSSVCPSLPGACPHASLCGWVSELPFPYKDTCQGSPQGQDGFISRSLITSAKTLFPNQVTSTEGSHVHTQGHIRTWTCLSGGTVHPLQLFTWF